MREDDIRKKIKILKRFYMEIINFIVVNAALVIIWLTFDRTGTFWPKYVLFIWGVLLVFKAYRMRLFSLIFPHVTLFNHDWEEKKVREFLRKQHKQQRRSPPTKEKEK